ncbi:dentin sialophosphoprotein-like [Sitodiplosis mosellana]|uniref:dentin sialophosphoprotein-like n=1 Tax=Sitodiplosis mosellana TaxID=263140 RepID=UPI0024440B91|nr:dentin sialophosphoprotein-like [Sitodiplosis mosellana]
MVSDCNWRLEAISKAAKNIKKTSFVLKTGENTVGKKKGIHIRIPSVLCSREHCTIFLDGDKVTLKDTSRNGTYITYPKETKHYTDTTAEKPLEQNDMISFGFNTASVYDVNDRNAFIYRLVKEQIETIDIDDSDDDDAPAPTKGKIIEITNKVIDIDSDSDSNYSGDECFQNIEEMEEEESSSSSCMIEDDVSYSDDYSESSDSLESGEESFVVTKSIIKCATPTETIALDEDDDEVPEVIEEKPTQSEESKVANGTVDEPSTSETGGKEAKSKEEDVTTTETEAKSEEKDAKSAENEAEPKKEDVKSTENVTESAHKDKPSAENDAKSETDQKSENETETKDDKTSDTTQKSSIESENNVGASTSKVAEKAARLERLRRNLAEKAPKQVSYTKAQPLRKRRQTISEDEYNQRKLAKKLDSETAKRIRHERLAKIGEKEKAKRDEAAEIAANTIRVTTAPKVKNIISRGEQLLTDMLALNPTNT